MKFILNIIRAGFRIFGVAAGAIGVAAFGFFVAILLMGDGLLNQTLGQVWYQHDPFVSLVKTSSLPLVGAIIERKIHPALWDPVALGLLGLPSWLALLILTALFLGIAVAIFALTRRRR